MKAILLTIAFAACLYGMGLVTGIYGFTHSVYDYGYEKGYTEGYLDGIDYAERVRKEKEIYVEGQWPEA